MTARKLKSACYTPPTPPGAATVPCRVHRGEGEPPKLWLAKADVSNPKAGAVVLLGQEAYTLESKLGEDETATHWTTV